MKLARTRRQNSEEGGITKQDVCELLKVTSSQAYSILKQLMAEEKLIRITGGKYSKYQIVDSLKD